MDDFYTARQHGRHTVVEFQTPSLVNPHDLERVGTGLFRMVDEEKKRSIVLDFAQVKYLSSQAIGVILTLNKKLSGGPASGDRLVLCGVGPQLQQLLKITRLDRVLVLKPTQQEAVAE